MSLLDAGRNDGPPVSRREFLNQALAAASATALAGSSVWSASGAEPAPASPIVVFSKVYQELSLGFDEAAATTAEAGLAGVDPPVRTGGEILPERAAEELPRYVEALRRRGLSMPLLTTGITSVDSPQTETILRTARAAGAQYYRLGFIERRKEDSSGAQVREVRAQLKDLAVLNRQVGIGALLQNHSPAGKTYFGGDLSELAATVEGFDPAQIGVAFDIAHALVVHGDDWRKYFERLKPHFKIAYIKDVKRAGRWVPFGQGDIGNCGYFKQLKELGYRAPISLHIEFDWTDGGKQKNREALVRTLRESSGVLRRWLEQSA
jgi:L-ribulose-5-phosphate 3-epimerase